MTAAPNSRDITSRSPAPTPLALAAILFACGIWLGGHLERATSLWAWCAFLLVGCAVVAVAQKNAGLAHIAAGLALLFAGALARIDSPAVRAPIPPEQFLRSELVEVTGHVTSDGVALPGSGPRERFDLETETLRLVDDGREFNQKIGIRVTTFEHASDRFSSPDSHLSRGSQRDPDTSSDQQTSSAKFDESPKASFPPLAYGDRVRFVSKLRSPRNFHNPGSFDYEAYLHGLGIAVLASSAAEDIAMLPGKSGRVLGFWRSRIRHSILEHMNGSGARPGLWDKDTASLFAAMVLGNDSLVERSVREEFQKTGVYHLLVVSGMNVAILAFALFWLARRSRAPDWLATVLTIALSVFYAYIAGLGVPIQRAVIMLSVFLLARLLYRDRASLNATGFAAMAVLSWSPAALFDAGFQLTFLALLAISGIALPVLERTSQPYRRALRHFDSTSYDLSLQPRLAQLRLDLRMIAGRLAVFLAPAPARWLVLGVAGWLLAGFELLVISSITQAVLVLPMRAYFHRAAIIGLPANAAVLPLAGIMLNSAVAAIALSYLFRPLALVAAWIASRALGWTLACLGWLSQLQVAQWRVPDAGWSISLVAVIGIVVTFVAMRGKRRIVVSAGGLALLSSAMIAAFVVAPPRVQRHKLEITAIDVGQGDSLLIVSPQGRSLLIDAGGNLGPPRGEFDFGEDVVSPYLWSRGFEHLDAVMLSHAHGDHIGGLARVIENFRPRELWIGINPETPALKQLYMVCAANGVAVVSHVAGDEFAWAGARIRVLSPPPGWHPKARPMNDDSLTFLISYGQSRALLAGDLERKMERFIAAESPSADLLKVAHHGSATSTTPELLAAVHPHFAIISVGANNRFGHPGPAVLKRLQESHVLTYRTDLLGAVTFVLDGNKVVPISPGR